MTKFTPRICVECGKPKGTIPYAVQEADGVMRSRFLHLRCINVYREKCERQRIVRNEGAAR